jgi:hypothetical protein
MIYGLPVVVSIIILKQGQYNEDTLLVQFISFACLSLDLKVLLFFRVFKRYARYFAIIISVAKQVYFFLVVFITIIMLSFAHAFYILLSPKSEISLDNRIINDDNNNPWNLVPKYQAFANEDDTVPTLFVVQQPDENTNMFTEFRTALFAVISFLSGIIFFEFILCNSN